MQRTIRLKSHLPYNQDQVWQALTDARLLGEWFMKNDIKPVPGHEFTFRMTPQKGWDGVTYCKVTNVEPLKSIEYTYQGKATAEKTLSCAGIHSESADKIAKGIFTELDTVLQFKLVPICGGTTLVLEHSGFSGLKLVIVSLVMGMGWKKQIRKKLPMLLKKIANNEVKVA